MIVRFVLSSALALSISFSSFGQQTESSEPDKRPEVKETIIVTATRGERPVSELPVSTTVVREEELKSAPATSIDDLLRTVAGVQMVLLGGATSTLSNQRFSMHGLGGNRALVLLDGVPIHDPYYGTVEWQKVPLDTLRQVEVVRGANASLFGNFALGGTVNLITRPVDASEVRADAAYGSNATQRATLTVDHVVNDVLAFRLSHHRYDTDGTYRFVTRAPVDVPGWENNAITSGRVDYRPSDRTSAFVKAGWSQIDISQGTALSYIDRGIFDLTTSVQHAVAGSGLVSGTLFRQHETFHIANSTSGATRLTEFLSLNGLVEANNDGGSLEWSLQRSGPLSFVSAGIDVQDSDATERADTLDKNGAVTQHDVITGHQRFAAVFAQASWRPADRLEILASARLDRYENTDASDAIRGGATTEFPATKSTQLDPRVSFRYATGERSAVRGSAYRGFKAPALRELYRNTQTGATTLVANPNLAPETLVGAEVGVETKVARAHVEVNVYRSVIDALQIRVPLPGLPAGRIQVQNVGRARSQGIEAMADLPLTARWTVSAAYTFADSIITDDPADRSVEGKEIPEVPRHLGSLDVRYRAPKGATLTLRGRVVSRSYGEPSNAVAAPAHRIVDLGASIPIRQSIEAYALLENAFDQRYFYVLTPTSFRAGQPRSVIAGFRLRMPYGRKN